jgi:hypothetical protein
MPTLANVLMEEVVTRLAGFSGLGVGWIKRDHRTVIPRDQCPAIHVIDGAETPASKSNGCYMPTKLEFRVAIFVRDDDGYAAADPIKIAVMAALNPDTAYTHSAIIARGPIIPEQEIADADSLRVDMHFSLSYQTGEWTL